MTFVVFGVVNELSRWFRPDGPKPPEPSEPSEQIAAEVTDFVLAALDPGSTAAAAG